MFKSIKQNKAKTIFIVFGFILAIFLISYFVCYLFDLGTISLVIAGIIAIVSTIGTYYNSDKIILASVNAREATMEEDSKLCNILDSLMVAANLKAKPRLYVVDDSQPNAFATGRNPENSIICVTTGLLDKLSYYELEGVIAHEMSHIKNYDILLSTIISVMLGFVIIISDRVFRFARFSKSNDDNKKNPLIVAIGLVFLILSPLFGQLMQLALSRKREFLADACAVDLTRNPQGLIDALRKLEGDQNQTLNVSKATENLFIVSPLKSNAKKSDLFSTHPSTQDRIEALENITKY